MVTTSQGIEGKALNVRFVCCKADGVTIRDGGMMNHTYLLLPR